MRPNYYALVANGETGAQTAAGHREEEEQQQQKEEEGVYS